MNSNLTRAGLTLYRHLLGLAKRIPLPEDLPPHPVGPRNPLAHQLRKSFARNRSLTSVRLVAAAFRNGYKALSLLKDSADASSLSNTKVVAFLRERLEEANRSRAAHPLTSAERRDLKVRGRELLLKRPILKRVPGPGQLPESAKGVVPLKAKRSLGKALGTQGHSYSELDYHYERATPPVPAEKLGGSGRRIVPQVDHVCYITPFLRYKKPQPRILSPILHGRVWSYQDKVDSIVHIQEEEMPNARMEDEWDIMTGEAPKETKGDLQPYTCLDEDLGETVIVENFSHGARRSYNYLSEKVTKIRIDAVLRTQALVKIAEEERALALKEKNAAREAKTRAFMMKKGIKDYKANPESGFDPISMTRQL